MYAVASIVVLVALVAVLDVACMVALDMRLAEVLTRAAIAVGLLSRQPEPTAPAPAPVQATPTPEPVEAISTPIPPTATPTQSKTTSYKGVRVGMPSDDVLKVWGRGTRPAEKVGSNAQGLIVKWTYEDATLVMKRWEIGGVTRYRVAEIRLR